MEPMEPITENLDKYFKELMKLLRERNYHGTVYVDEKILTAPMIKENFIQLTDDSIHLEQWVFVSVKQFPELTFYADGITMGPVRFVDIYQIRRILRSFEKRILGLSPYKTQETVMYEKKCIMALDPDENQKYTIRYVAPTKLKG